VTLSPWRWVTFAWLIAGAFSLAVLATPIVRLPSDDVGLLRRFTSPEIVPGIRLSQTFEMTADGLRAVEVWPIVVGQVSGDIMMELFDVTENDDRLMRIFRARAADVAAADPYRFEFTPIPDSENRVYQLDVTTSSTNRASGIAIWATKGERYAGGSMLVNGVPRWADVAFRADAPVPSGLQLLTAVAVGSGLSRGHVVLAALAASWIALGVFLRAFTRMSDDSREGAL